MNTARKKHLTIILAIVLVATVAIGGTLAYLFTTTDTKTNVFTFADNIKAYLDEPSWVPEDALNLVPGKEIAKDPQIKNTSENGVVEYAAIRLTFLDGAGNEIQADDMVELLNLIDIDWSNNWTLKQGTLTADMTGTVTAATAKQIYIFNDTLPQGVTSDPVFYSVTIPSDITSAQLAWLVGDYGHVEACYEAGAHDSMTCTITYRHHEKCALNDGINSAAEIAGTQKGNVLGAETCDCNTVEIHNSECPLLIKSLSGDCTDHDEVIAGLGNFTIKVEGAVVQADVFDGLFGSDPAKSYASDALVTLFS